MGIAQAGMVPSAAKAIGGAFPEREQGTASGLLGSAMLAGGTIAPGLTALLLKSLDLQAVFAWYAVPGLVWAGLFPDFLQRFLPFPIYAFDRAVTLEKSFEYVWDLRQGGDNSFRNSFFDLCGPGSGKCSADVAAPALLINATNVETGAQMVLSPLYLGQTYILQTGVLEDYFRKSATVKQMPLSTALGLSSRFPWILPVGWYDFTLPPPINTDEQPEHRRMTIRHRPSVWGLRRILLPVDRWFGWRSAGPTDW